MQNFTLNEIASLQIAQSYTYIIIDGVYQPALSNPSTAVEFAANTLTIPADSTLTKPLHLLFLTTTSYQYTLTIVTAPESKITLLEEHVALNNCAATSKINLNIITEANSALTHYKINQEILHSKQHTTTQITQKQNSQITSNFIGKGVHSASEMLYIKLLEPNATYHSCGIIELYDTQQLNYHAHIEHLAPNCKSNLLCKGIISAQAKGDFKCLVLVHPQATKTETHVTNKNLLLSEESIMNSAPDLEVYTDDVICTHGATIGHLDPEALLYLRSRGLPHTQAISLLTSAFIKEIVEQFAPYLQPKLKLDLYEY